MSNWFISSDETEFSDRYLKAEFEVVSEALLNHPGETSIDWGNEMDIKVSKILQRDSEAPLSTKLDALRFELKARMALLLEKHC